MQVLGIFGKSLFISYESMYLQPFSLCTILLCLYNCLYTGQGASDPRELKKKAALLVSQPSPVCFYSDIGLQYAFSSVWFTHYMLVWDHKR